MATDNSILMVGLYDTPMSKRALEHNMRLMDVLSDLVDVVSINGPALQASVDNLPQINQAIDLVLSANQRMRDRITANGEKLEGLVERILMVDLRAQEKAYLQHLSALEGVIKSSSNSSEGGGYKVKNKNSGKDKSGGWFSNPKKGGCHRCGSPHLVRSWPRAVVAA